MIKLSVNLNAIAMLRNRRDLDWFDILHFANLALLAGAHGITVHPRPDQRHIRFEDIAKISIFLKTSFPQAEFNIEGYPSEEFLALAMPYADQITLVPDAPEQKTSDHGWNFSKDFSFLTSVVQQIKTNKIRVSAFSNPLSDGLELARALDFDRIEFYTGPYAFAHYKKAPNLSQELRFLEEAGKKAQALGLEINAGHDLNLENLPSMVERLPFLAEVSIGHALTIDALEYGIKSTIKRFLDVLT